MARPNILSPKKNNLRYLTSPTKLDVKSPTSSKNIKRPETEDLKMMADSIRQKTPKAKNDLLLKT